MKQVIFYFLLLLLFSSQAFTQQNNGSWWQEDAKTGVGEATNKIVDGKSKTKKEKKNKKKKKQELQSDDLEILESDSEEVKNVQPTQAEDLRVEKSQSQKGKEADADTEGGYTVDSKRSSQTIVLRTRVGCILVEYGNTDSAIFSCTKPLAITYTKRSCSSSKIDEIGSTEAIITCEDSKSFGMHFRTKENIVSAKLLVNRRQSGRRGAISTYIVKKTKVEQSFAQKLKQPELKDLEADAPEETPLVFKFSGFATVEFEQSERYGYDVGATGLTAASNFTNSVTRPTRRTASLFSNFNFGVVKDRTTIQSILEVGEVYSGNTASGGAQGARVGNIIEIRNFYLEHKISESLAAIAGVYSVATDPRSFIYNDHTSVAYLAYQHDLLNTKLWYGAAQKSLPSATTYLQDRYISLQANLNFLSGIKNTLFLTHREQANANFAKLIAVDTYTTVTGKAKYLWVGGTFEYAGFDPLMAEATVIGNWNGFEAPGITKDVSNSYLADVKIGYNLNNPQLGFTLEGLMTPGAKNAVDTTTGNKVLKKRKGFQSPVGAAYLMTVATNDGVDDAAGTPKQSIIGNLGLDEGLRILVGTVNKSFTKKWSLFFRYGIIRSEANANNVNNSNEIGNEVDVGSVYQLSPSTIISFDYGHFKPGRFYINRSPANLFSLKYKLNF